MDRIQRFWLHRSVTARSFCSAIVFAAAVGESDTQSNPQTLPIATTVRAHVAITVSIESELYRRKLDGADHTCGPNCATMERALADTLRAMFDARFRFADWSNGGGPSRDTVSIRLRQKNPSNGPVILVMSLTGRARQYAHAPEEVEFESWIFATQLRSASDWAPARLRGAWGDSLARRLDTFSPRLLANVIGRLPLAGDVVFDAARVAANVQVPADSLRAASSPAPKFLVRLSMPSRTATGDVVPDTGELVLEPCRRTTRGFYACELGGFTWRDKSGTDSLFRQKARDSRVTTASVHLQEYTPLPASLTAGGLAAPRNP